MGSDRHVVAELVVLADRGALSGLQTRSDPRAGVDRGEWADHRSRADEQWKLALPLAARLLPVANALDEMPHLDLERFSHRDARAVDVAGAIAAPQLFARELFDAQVVDLHLFDRLDVIVEDHLLRSDHRHRAELGWREPRKMRVRDRSRRE